MSWHSFRMRPLNPSVRHTQPVRFALHSAVEQSAANDEGGACRRHRVTTSVDGATQGGCCASEHEARAKQGVCGYSSGRRRALPADPRFVRQRPPQQRSPEEDSPPHGVQERRPPPPRRGPPLRRVERYRGRVGKAPASQGISRVKPARDILHVEAELLDLVEPAREEAVPGGRGATLPSR